MLRQMIDAKNVAAKLPLNQETLDAAFETLRTSGSDGRNLAKSYRKLKDGKLRAPALKLAVLVGSLQEKDEDLRNILVHYWVGLMNDDLPIDFKGPIDEATLSGLLA